MLYFNHDYMGDKIMPHKYTTVDGANTLITTYHLANKYGLYKIFCDQWMTEDKQICFWTAILQFGNQDEHYLICNVRDGKLRRFKTRSALLENLCRDDFCIVEFRSFDYKDMSERYKLATGENNDSKN